MRRRRRRRRRSDNRGVNKEDLERRTGGGRNKIGREGKRSGRERGGSAGVREAC